MKTGKVRSITSNSSRFSWSESFAFEFACEVAPATPKKKPAPGWFHYVADYLLP